MRQYNTQRGFSMLDLVIAMALISILAGIATPNISRWMTIYRLKGASTDIFSNMQMAKLGSVKDNKSWSINFTESGYQILNGDGVPVKDIDFNKEYSGNILYKNPTGGDTIGQNPLIFNPNGTTNNVAKEGFIYITNQDNTDYYRVGPKYASGGIKVEKWDGAEWK